MPTSYALITGASSGLGKEFAHQLAAQGYHLILVSRRQEALEKVAHSITNTYPVGVEILPADLTLPADLDRVCNRLQDAASPVTYLVNNAGFGIGKSLAATTLETHLAQVDLLFKAPLALMHTALASMKNQRQGTVINIASTAAFTPGGTYSATKRALLTLSQSAHLEYKPHGITVTAICPGLTRSNFHRAMNQPAPTLPKIFWLEPQRVVQEALEAAEKGRAVWIPSLPYKALSCLSQLLPASWVGGALGKTRKY